MQLSSSRSRLWSRFLCCFDHENVLRLALFRSRPERNAGHYIPQLAEAMVEFNKKDRIFNLRGVAVSLLELELSLRALCLICIVLPLIDP